MPEDFFRDVTLQLCSTLDLQTALRRTMPVLARHFPAQVVSVAVLDTKLGAVRRVAHVDASDRGPGPSASVTSGPPLLPLPEHLWRWLEGLSGPLLLNDLPGKDAEAFRRLVKLEGYSDLVLVLRIEGQQVGFLVLRAAGRDRFTGAHRELLASVADPFSIAVSNALAHLELLGYRDALLDDNRFLHRELSYVAAEDVIGASTGLRSVMALVQQAAPLPSTVLLLGETGVGKDIVAHVLHHSSPRTDGPFIKVNCGAIPEGLIDSELFGHERGAFTGAHVERRGRFERANGGTIFLDEIGELPPHAQIRLLRVLQNREFERVGGTRSIQVDIRVVAATHRDLTSLVALGRFREDLWFRLNVFPITIPPLRERRDDVPALVRHFVQAKCRELGLRAAPAIAPGALARLQAYGWPGNVRELENLIERELIRSQGDPLRFDEIALAPPVAQAPEPAGPLRLDDVTGAHIQRVLAMTSGKIHGPGGAAELLGVNENTLRNRMNRLGIVYGRRAKTARGAARSLRGASR